METTNEWNKFKEKYKPIKNPQDTYSEFEGTFFESPNIPEVDYKRVFTLVECEDGEEVIMAGKHLVNRLGYFICELRWRDEDEYETFTILNTREEMWRHEAIESIGKKLAHGLTSKEINNILVSHFSDSLISTCEVSNERLEELMEEHLDIRVSIIDDVYEGEEIENNKTSIFDSAL